MPTYRICVGEEEEYYHSLGDFNRRSAELAVATGGESTDNGDQILRITKEELHEARRLNELRALLEPYSITPADYFRREEHTVAGEHVPTKFVLIDEEHKEVDVANPTGVIKGIRDIGSRGIEIKRFKGLGEMNGEELWETTMDPSNRGLLKVVISDDADDPEQLELDAREADRIFSILMGDNVEARRQFIEANAAHVKNLDV